MSKEVAAVPPNPARLIELLSYAVEFAACAMRDIGGGGDPTGPGAREPMLWAFQNLGKAMELSAPGSQGDIARLLDRNERLTAALEAA